MALVSANPAAFFQMGAGLGEAIGSLGDAQKEREISALATQAFDQWYGADPSQGVPMSRLGEALPTGTATAGVSTTPTGTAGPATTQGGTFQPFMSTVAQGIQNPYGLAAVAATGLHESRFNPANANRTWSDPSQSGQPGTAGGILSWRGDRLQNLYRFAAQRGEQPGNISPQTQAAFFLQENPQLVNQLNSANSLEQAQALMNNAWRFAGYNQPGGEAAARVASARSYLPEMTNDAVWRGLPQGTNPQDMAQNPVGTPLPPGVDPRSLVQNMAASGTPTRVASLDPSAGFSSLPPNLAAARGQNTPSGAPRERVAQAQPQGMQPGAGAGAQQNQIAAVRMLLANPRTRDIGMQMWQSMARPQLSPYDFQVVGDQLVRINKQTGEVAPVQGLAAPQQKPTQDIQEYQFARQQGYQGSFADWQNQKRAPQQTTITAEAQQRAALAQQQGLDPNSPEGRAYILTGKLPGSDRQVTAGDRQAIREADDVVQSGQAALTTLDRIQELSKQAYDGAGASMRGWLGSQVGIEGANATVELDNATKELALGQLKSIFGAAPTEGERQILIEVQGASSQPQAVRERIYARARAAVEKRIQFNKDRATELRGGTYYDPRPAGGPQQSQGGSQAPQQAQPTQQSAPPAQGARQAPDGNWYVPDPSRPGKYLQVQP